MNRVIAEESPTLWLYIDKAEGCILTTKDKNRSSPVYEIADWVQFLTNRPSVSHSSAELKQLHDTFQKIWERYISQLTVPQK